MDTREIGIAGDVRLMLDRTTDPDNKLASLLVTTPSGSGLLIKLPYFVLKKLATSASKLVVDNQDLEDLR